MECPLLPKFRWASRELELDHSSVATNLVTLTMPLHVQAGKKEDPITKQKRKLKWQLMLQVDQNNPQSATLLFGFKKKFDLGRL
jgi:hypothetical protein